MKTVVRKMKTYSEPADVFDVVHAEKYCAILDSSLVSEDNRYTIIGLCPYRVYSEKNGVAFVDGKRLDVPVEAAVGEYLKEAGEANDTSLPLISGGIGYFSYDFGCKFERIPISHPKEGDMPDALFCFYDHFIIFDLLKRELYLTAKGMLDDAEISLDRLEERLEKREKISFAEYKKVVSDISYDFEKGDYEAAIRRMIGHIVEGDIYIANMTRRMNVVCAMDPYLFFKKMRERNPSPFGGFLQYGDVQIVCASPERFLRVKDGKIETTPIKGTRPRGRDREEDEFFRKELERSAKDRSELLMIVDLERNDLNRICETGSVKVRDPFHIEAYATVFHLVSTVTGRLRADVSFSDLLRAVFPGGSVTGAPKIEAMRIIDDLERGSRGLYTGSIGYLSLNGDCDLNIVIRTAVCQNGVYRIGIGGGITCESDPEAEFEETLQKGKAFYDIFCEVNHGDDSI